MDKRDAGHKRAKGARREVSASASERFARRLGLRIVTVDELTITRRRHGRAFVYFLEDGSRVRDEPLIQRLRRLAVPPAYVDALYCADERGHLQAVWRDAAGRQQYRYHPDWEKVREDRRLRRLARLSQALPRIRRALRRRLAQRQPTRDFALAAIVELAAATGIRPVRGEYVALTFCGKGGKTVRKQVHAPRFADAVEILRPLPGPRLFQYRDSSGGTRAVRAREVNDFLRRIAKMAISLKDFRTLTAATTALEALSHMNPAPSTRQQKKQISEAMRAAAGELSNTPAICRKSYVPSLLVTAFEDGRLREFGERGRRTSRRERLLTELLAAAGLARSAFA